MGINVTASSRKMTLLFPFLVFTHKTSRTCCFPASHSDENRTLSRHQDRDLDHKSSGRVFDTGWISVPEVTTILLC